MTKQILTSPGLPPPVGVFSQATSIDNPKKIIFVSGLTSRGPSGEVMHPGDVKSQTRLILENMKAILREGGATLEDVVRVTVYVRNMADFAAIHEVRREYFPKDPPASTMVEVSRLVDERMLIEIEATAVLN
ncbi:MAG: RidA family protein [Chloroflexota bacterium]|jgi:2-iminobutanoate/2-iminopropanoate deaminase